MEIELIKDPVLVPKSKRLLFVIDNLSTGGAQRQMINLAIGLIQRGYWIEFFCYSPGDLLAQPLHDAGIKIHYSSKQNRYSPGVIIALMKLINAGKYDLVLSFLPTPNFYAILAGRLLVTKRLPVIISERRSDLPQGVSLIKRFSRQFYRLASHLVTNSFSQRDDLAKKYPWLKNRLSTIYNGYDLSYFAPAPVFSENNPLRILAIAHVTPYKNGLCLVEALHQLKTHEGLLPQVDWIGQMVMRGTQLEYLSKMKRTISEYGLESQWHWLNQRNDIVDQLQQHDVLVHPSYGEGLPNVVCEALACGRPVIVSDLLDHSRLVQNGKNGYLFNHRDPADLAEKIKKFNALAQCERIVMGQNGREFAEANLSVERLTNDYEELITRFLS